jgi:hypothetical protein
MKIILEFFILIGDILFIDNLTRIYFLFAAFPF